MNLAFMIKAYSFQDCRRIRILSVKLRAVSLFSWSVEQNARDTQITTRVTEGASFIRRGSPLRSNPFTEEWCPFRRPTNSKSSHHFFFVAIRCIEVFKKTTLINTSIIIFPTLSYTSTHEMPTLLDMLSLKKVPLSGRAFHLGHHREYPPGQKQCCQEPFSANRA